YGRLNDDGDVRLGVLVARERETPPRRIDTTGRLEPAGQIHHRIDDVDRPLIGQVRPPERIGSGARGVGELVDERLDGEHVAERTQAARRRGPDRTATHEVGRDALVADLVQRVGVAVGPGMEATHRSRTRTLLGSGPRPGAEKAGALRTEREGATEVRVAVGVVVP